MAEEAARQEGQWIVVSATPDACYTDVGGHYVCVVYTILGHLDKAEGVSKNVFANGKPAFHMKSAVFVCEGDGAAAAGVASGVKEAVCFPIDGSPTVFINRQKGVRHGTPAGMNAPSAGGSFNAMGFFLQVIEEKIVRVTPEGEFLRVDQHTVPLWLTPHPTGLPTRYRVSLTDEEILRRMMVHQLDGAAKAAQGWASDMASMGKSLAELSQHFQYYQTFQFLQNPEQLVYDFHVAAAMPGQIAQTLGDYVWRGGGESAEVMGNIAYGVVAPYWEPLKRGEVLGAFTRGALDFFTGKALGAALSLGRGAPATRALSEAEGALSLTEAEGAAGGLTDASGAGAGALEESLPPFDPENLTGRGVPFEPGAPGAPSMASARPMGATVGPDGKMRFYYETPPAPGGAPAAPGAAPAEAAAPAASSGGPGGGLTITAPPLSAASVGTKPGYTLRLKLGTPDPGLDLFVAKLRADGVNVLYTNVEVVDSAGVVRAELDVVTDNAIIQYKDGISSAQQVIEQVKVKTEPFVNKNVIAFINDVKATGKAARTVEGALRKDAMATSDYADLLELLK